MRQRTFFGSMGLVGLALLQSAQAAPFQPKYDNPQTYAEVQKGIAELKKNIESVQCGGWTPAADASGGGASIPVPTVNGAPGRTNTQPTGDIKTGIGKRPDAFEYPTTALGFKTACDIHQPKDNRGNDINPQRLCLRENIGKDTPQDCKKLYDFLLKQQKDAKRNTNCDGTKEKLCFDYTSQCTGDGCRTTFDAQFEYTPPACRPPPLPPIPEKVVQKQASFYRHYSITVEAPESNQWQVSAECYDNYIEKDTKTNVTMKNHFGGKYADTQPYEQCELKFGQDLSAFNSSSSSVTASSAPATGGSSSSAPSPEWKPESRQKAEYKPQTGLVGENDDVRAARTAAEPWVVDPLTNLSILDMQKAKENLRNLDDEDDITPFATSLIAVRQKASKTSPAHSRTDDFDDTGERDFVSWWQIQQKEMMKMTRQPQISLLLPSRFLTGLNEKDPLFAYAQNTISKSNGISEITVHAGSEELGNLLLSLQQTFFLPIEEVRVPVIVPLLSETEANTRIAEWKLWQKENPTHSADADPFIEKIERYRDSALRVREMRTVLPNRSKQLLAVQKQVRGFYASWYLQNAKRVQQWAQVNVVRTQIKKSWNKMATALLDAAKCQLDWCSNQRYSLAIYSLLDSWYRKSVSGGDVLTAKSLATLNYVPPKDQSIDLSWLQIGSGSTLQMPVLWPIQVRLNLPLPPTSINNTLPDIRGYPDLPEYTDEYGDLFGSIPVPDVHFPDGIRAKDADGTDYEIADTYLVPAVEREDVLSTALSTINTLATSIDGDETSRDNLKGAYCRFTKSLRAPVTDSGSEQRIVHVEYDLKERVARLFARYEPNVDADFKGKVDRIADLSPKPPCFDDVPCVSLPGEKHVRDTWQWTIRSVATDIQTTYEVLRDSVLPAMDQNPYLDAARSALERSMPLITLPLRLDLSPTFPTIPAVPIT
ncbi:MAG: hypothetical protein KBD00_04425 [Candidatus Peribacteraceae bacterium]|nr:hypothetical protein [Candidatus Peribacteraceae bacterium]